MYVFFFFRCVCVGGGSEFANILFFHLFTMNTKSTNLSFSRKLN